MLNEEEINVLDVLSKRLLAKPSELSSLFGRHDGISTILQRLQSMDCVKVVEPIGEKCFVITQKGTRVLREAKNPERRTEPRQDTFLTS
jgi:hypothetical protein